VEGEIMRRFTVFMLFAALLVSLLALPASAKGKDDSPAQICKSIDNTFPPTDDRPFPFEIQSTGGCVSSVAQGFPDDWSALSRAAFISQCKWLEDGVYFPDGTYFELTYPYSFYGNPDYTAYNRADCMYFLYSFHNGLLPPGPGA
jgi:hypothetical protein